MAYVQKGMLREAIALLNRAIDLSPGDKRDLAGLARAYALSGRRDDAMKIAKELRRSSTGGFDVLWVAAGYAALADRDQAFEWLERAYRDRDFTFELLRYEPYWDGIRSDPRFADLLHRIGLTGGPR
jgi:tetratricopeptide (TPR) repeat protein